MGGGGVVLGCITVMLVTGYTGTSPLTTIPLLLFLHFFIQSTRFVWTLVTSPQQKKNVWEQNPGIMFFNPCPKQKTTEQ